MTRWISAVWMVTALFYSGPDAPAPESGEWRVVHALMLGCQCSAKRAAYIREHAAGADEQIVWMDPEAAVKPYGLTGGPWLLIYAPDGRLMYSGGYGGALDSHKKVLEAVRAGKSSGVRQVFGCRMRYA